jgi:predicted metal-dependent phosphoesterase TrpH
LKIDLHVHCSERSGCGRSAEEEQIQAAIAAGLDAMAFTDHFKFIPPVRQAELNNKYAPFLIFRGIEVTASLEDFIVLGVGDAELESQSWTYPNLHGFVRMRKGYIIMAHPFRYHSELSPEVIALPPDAIEVRSVNTPAEAERRIREVATNLKLQLMWNSDAHIATAMGSYFNVIDSAPVTDKELPAALRKSNIRSGGMAT